MHRRKQVAFRACAIASAAAEAFAVAILVTRRQPLLPNGEILITEIAGFVLNVGVLEHKPVVDLLITPLFNPKSLLSLCPFDRLL